MGCAFEKKYGKSHRQGGKNEATKVDSLKAKEAAIRSLCILSPSRCVSLLFRSVPRALYRSANLASDE